MVILEPQHRELVAFAIVSIVLWLYLFIICGVAYLNWFWRHLVVASVISFVMALITIAMVVRLAW